MQTEKPERALRAFRRDTARPFNCHDPDARRTGHLESGRLLRSERRWVKGRSGLQAPTKALPDNLTEWPAVDAEWRSYDFLSRDHALGAKAPSCRRF